RARTASAGHLPVAGGVDGYAVKPSVESAFAPELGQRPISLDECFLGDVLDFARITDHPGQQAHDFSLVLQDQQIESTLVPALYPRHQLGIDLAFAHGLSFLEPPRCGMAVCRATHTHKSRQACGGRPNFQTVSCKGLPAGTAFSLSFRVIQAKACQTCKRCRGRPAPREASCHAPVSWSDSVSATGTGLPHMAFRGPVHH